MDNIYYLKDSKEFWETHEEARKARDKRLAGLPFSKKAAISAKLQVDYEVMRNAREEFGLGEIPPDAMNDLSIEQPFTQEDFKTALNKIFPFTQELQADQES